VLEFVQHARDNGTFSRNRSLQARYWMYEFIDESLRSRFFAQPGIREKLEILEKEVLSGEKSSFHAAMEILDIYNRGENAH
jgi:LAO/AO transport system kinase